MARKKKSKMQWYKMDLHLHTPASADWQEPGLRYLDLLRKAEMQQQYKDAARKTGVEVASLAIGELNEIPYKSDPRTPAWVSDSIDVCAKMGTRVVLLAFFGDGAGLEPPESGGR